MIHDPKNNNYGGTYCKRQYGFVHGRYTSGGVILWCYRYSGRRLYARRTLLGDPRVCHVYYGAIGTLGEGYVCRTPLGDPRVCHVYYGAIGILGEGYVCRTPLGDPRVCHVYYGASYTALLG